MSAALLTAGQVAAKATRDGLFLSRFAVSELPKAMLAGAMLGLLTAYATSRALSRFGPARVVPPLMAANALLFGAEWLALPLMPRLVAAVLYVHVVAAGASGISAFWSIINERFDPHSARRAVARITVGATVGGLVGGLLAERLSAWVDARAVLAALVALNASAAFTTGRIGSAVALVRARTESSARAPRSSYLLRVAGLVLLVGVASSVLDFVFKAQVATTHQSAEALTAFFAVFYTVVGLATLLIQAGVTRGLLERFGLGAGLALLPAAVLLFGTTAALISRLATVVAAKAVDSVLGNSVFRSAYELLYTPLSEERKRRAKVLVDVGADRAGEMLGSGIMLGAVLLIPALPPGVLIAVGLAAAACALWLARSVRDGYVEALVASLRSNESLAESLDLRDATTRDSLSRTFGTVDRTSLLAQIEQLHRQRAGSQSPEGADAEPSSSQRATDAKRLLGQLTALTSPNSETVRRALASPDLDVRLAPQVIVLLGDRRVSSDAQQALGRFRSSISGLLADALLDPKRPPTLRRRIPALLGADASEHAAAALSLALSADRFDVRYRAAQALASLVRRQPTLRPSAKLVEQRILCELGEQTVGLHEPGGPARALRRYVFFLLGLNHDTEALGLALRAIETGDGRLAGVALEYLDNVLSDPVRGVLLGRLESRPQKPRTGRASAELLAELTRSLLGYAPDDRSSVLPESL